MWGKDTLKGAPEGLMLLKLRLVHFGKLKRMFEHEYYKVI